MVTARCLAIALLSSLIPIIGSSHHAAAGLYDREAVGMIEGEVVSVFWRNPHVRFTVESLGEDGVSETWEIEGGSVNTLERVGIYASTVQVGDHVSFWGFPGRNGQQVIFAREMTLSGGRRVPLAPIEAMAPYPRPRPPPSSRSGAAQRCAEAAVTMGRQDST